MELSDSEIDLIAIQFSGRTYSIAKCLNRQWARVLGNLKLRKLRFMKEWNVHVVTGIPRSSSLLEIADLKTFSILHILQKNDTLASLAIYYHCSVMQLKINNNLSSEHALMSRHEIFIPINTKSKIAGQDIQIVYNDQAKREYLLVSPPGSRQVESGVIEDSGEETKIGLSETKSQHSERVRKQLIIMMSRMFKIDHLVSEAYLSVANWDPHKAILQYRQDEHWQEDRRL